MLIKNEVTKIDVDNLKSNLEKYFSEVDIINDVYEALEKFKLKVSNRRKQVDIYEKELDDDSLDPQKKLHHIKFINKVEINESKLLEEQRIIIRRTLCDSFDKIKHKLDKDIQG